MRYFGAKLLLLIISILMGILVGYVYWGLSGTSHHSVVIGLATSFLYPVIGVIIIALCEAMKRWAYGRQVPRWDIETRLLLATVSPLVLVVCAILYLYMGIINRLY
jgi:hypothetical protein